MPAPRFPLAAVLLLSACALEMTNAHVMRPGVPEFFGYAAASGAVPTVILGNPFALSKTETDAAVADAMAEAATQPRARYSTAADPASRADTRVVVVFNPERTLTPYAACGPAERIKAGPAEGDRVRFLVVLCSGTDPMSRVEATAAEVDGPRHPRFRRVMATALQDMVPAIDPFVDQEPT